MKTVLKSTVAASVLLLMSGCFEEVKEVKGIDGVDSSAVEISKPEYGLWGVDLAARKENIKPGDDFYEYAVGNWMDTVELPVDQRSYGPFSVLQARTSDRVKIIVEELAAATHPEGSVEQKVADFYNNFLDVKKLTELGISPLQKRLDEIKNINTVEDLTAAFGKYYTRSPIFFYPQVDVKNPSIYQMEVYYTGFRLPDKSYYSNSEERFVKIRKDYVEYIEKMLRFAGEERPEEKAQAVLALETKMAAIQWDRKDLFDADKTQNQLAYVDLTKKYPGLNWDLLFKEAGYGAFADLNMYQPSAIRGAIKLINEQPLEDWKAYLTLHLVSAKAEYLSEEIYNTEFDFHQRTLYGQTEPKPRWERAIGNIYYTRALSDAVGKVYVERYFPESSKRQVLKLVENLRGAFQENLEKLDWHGEETRSEALKKIKEIKPVIGYPNKWKDHTSVHIKAGDLFGNKDEFDVDRRQVEIGRLNKKSEEDDVRMLPFMVNAFYDPQYNRVMFPAGILQPPYFDPAADIAVNYGAIGAVIGHEIGHGFDEGGARFDSGGVMRNWWQEDDRKDFETRIRILVEQYNKFEALPGKFVNGELTLRENIADLVGLQMAYDAYQRALNGKTAPVIDGLTGDQRFFLAYAQATKRKSSEEILVERLKTSQHSPAQFRVNGIVRNMQEWYDAFGVKEGDALYLAPEDRVAIW